MKLLRFASTAIAVFLSISASALPIYETVLPDQYFAIDFKFKADTGDADVLLANGGATSLGLLGSNIELYVNNKLLASWLNPMANTFAVFSEPGSYYTAWGTTADLDKIFDGKNARLEFHPIFDSVIEGAFVDYQLTAFGAAQSKADGTLSDDIVAPKIKSYGVFDERHASVPEPASFGLLAAGIAALWLRRKKLTQLPAFTRRLL